MDDYSWRSIVLGTLAITVAIALLVTFVWAMMVRSVAEDRRHHEEHLREIQVCQTSKDPAACFRELSL